MGRMETNKSMVVIGQSKSASLRTTIPANIAKQLNLTAGDTLDWSLDKNGNTWMVKVTKE